MLLPLLSRTRFDEILAWRQGSPVSVSEFLQDVHRVASVLPAERHVLNFCQDRYRFVTGLAAAVLANKLSLLPSTRTTETLDRLKTSTPDVFVLTDVPCDVDLPCIQYPVETSVAATQVDMPMIDGERVVAHVFTSGSTGEPVSHAKTWGNLIRCIHAGVESLGLGSGLSLVGTVPAQHMYGFESTALIALHGGVAMSAAHPFYPADIAAELARVPAPRLLVSTPVHLRALLAAEIDIPPLAGVLCATAPLSTELAIEIETRFDAPLMEIYGSTETGQIATRRTAQTDVWELFPGVTLHPDDQGGWLASGGHISMPYSLSDLLEPIDASHFLLRGRHADMVNIAGKRSSINYLNHHLCSIPGVVDGAFFLPDNSESGVTRLMAFAVAPGMDRQQLLDALRQRIDPAFMPRPLVLLETLPRNATGKLPRHALAELAASHLSSEIANAAAR